MKKAIRWESDPLKRVNVKIQESGTVLKFNYRTKTFVRVFLRKMVTGKRARLFVNGIEVKFHDQVDELKEI